MQKIKQLYLKYKEIIDYLIVGGLTTVIAVGVKFGLLFTILNAEDAFQLQISVIISWIAAVIFAYFTNRVFVFKSKSKSKEQLKEFISFVIARIATLLLDMFIMWFFVTLLKLNSNLYVIIFTLFSQILVVIGNYVFSKLFVFKKESEN